MSADHKQPGHDDANPNPGTGASGPGEPGYESEAQVNVVGGEAAIELEDRRRAMEADADSDPGTATGA